MGDDLDQLRAEACLRLDEDWAAGRIDPTEHERRTTELRRAMSPEDVRAAADGRSGGAGGLSPIPSIPSVPAVPVSADSGSASAVAVPASRTSSRGLSPKAAGAIAGVVPLLSVLMFFLTADVMDHNWVWFLLIPMVGTVMPPLTRNDETAAGATETDGEQR